MIPLYYFSHIRLYHLRSYSVFVIIPVVISYNVQFESGLHLHLAPLTSPISKSNAGFSTHTTCIILSVIYGVSMSTMAVSNLFSAPSINVHTLYLQVSCLGATSLLFTHIVEHPVSLRVSTTYPLTFPGTNFSVWFKFACSFACSLLPLFWLLSLNFS